MLQLWSASALGSVLDFLAVNEMICCGSGNGVWESRGGAGLHRGGHFVYSLIFPVYDQDLV